MSSSAQQAIQALQHVHTVRPIYRGSVVFFVVLVHVVILYCMAQPSAIVNNMDMPVAYVQWVVGGAEVVLVTGAPSGDENVQNMASGMPEEHVARAKSESTESIERVRDDGLPVTQLAPVDTAVAQHIVSQPVPVSPKPASSRPQRSQNRPTPEKVEPASEKVVESTSSVIYNSSSALSALQASPSHTQGEGESGGDPTPSGAGTETGSLSGDRAGRAASSSMAQGPVTLQASQVRFRHRATPVYPREAQLKRLEGTVVVSLLIDTQGRPRQVIVHTSSGYRQLDDAGIFAAQKSTFHPHVMNGHAVEARSVITYEFRLR